MTSKPVFDPVSWYPTPGEVTQNSPARARCKRSDCSFAQTFISTGPSQWSHRHKIPTFPWNPGTTPLVSLIPGRNLGLQLYKISFFFFPLTLYICTVGIHSDPQGISQGYLLPPRVFSPLNYRSLSFPIDCRVVSHFQSACNIAACLTVFKRLFLMRAEPDSLPCPFSSLSCLLFFWVTMCTPTTCLS